MGTEPKVNHLLICSAHSIVLNMNLRDSNSLQLTHGKDM